MEGLKIITYNELLNRHSEIEKIRSFGYNDNDLKIKYSKPILDTHGQIFDVHPPAKKSMKMKSGNCYGNAHSKREKGYEYVEGIIKDKITGFEISHAWNVDSNGVHYDFTLIDTNSYVYKGLVVPFSLRYQIAEKTGKVWYCVLPYISY
jgi:hypothetical protein